MSFTVWCNADLPASALEDLRVGLGEHRLVMSSQATSNLVGGGPSPEMNEADIAFGQPDPKQAMELDRLDWVHITSAGYTRYDTEAFRAALNARGAKFTNSSSVYDDPCAQHILAFMLAHARQIPMAVKATPHWSYDAIRPVSRILENETVVILGYGAIGKRLVELLAPFRMKIIGVRRNVRGDEGIEMRSIKDLSDALANADHVINILPASAETDELIDSGAFASMKTGAVFYNIGRGTTVDQSALVGVLESGKLAAAYLDVTDPEPLSASHSLWTAPNCLITPHVAGGRQQEASHLVKHFLLNLRAYEVGEPMADRII